MRFLARFGLALAAAVVMAAAAAKAEDRVFIIANHADGYGVDRCLSEGERCGTVVATAYCQSQAFTLAKSFRKVEREEITGAVPASTSKVCAGSCESFVAIECSR
jgi:hypothetical protein